MKIINSASRLIIVILLATTGCSLHKSNIAETQLKIPQTYSQENETPAPPAGKWWEQFEDENLNSLIEEALRHNLDIAQAYERLNQSLASLRIAGSSGWPVVNADGSAGRARKPGALGPVTDNSFDLSAAASYEIDIWQKIKSKNDAARFDMLASEQDLRALFISISAQVADLYFLAVEQKAQIELSDGTIESFQDTLERVERRYRGGLVSTIDVYQSRQNLAGAKAQRPVFESGMVTALNSISVLAGRFPAKKSGATIDKLKDAPVFPEGIPSQLLSGRPDVKASFMRLQASDKKIAEAIADRFPAFNLTGAYGGSSDRVSTVLDSPNIFWNILLQAAQPVFDAGRRKAEVKRTEAVFRENLAKYHQAVLVAFREVEDALVKGRTSEERIKMLNENVAASENSYRLALDNYMQGLTDYLPVLTEQLRHFTVKSNLLSAKRQLISDRIQLARALGGEWVNEKKITNYESQITNKD
jgi:NodT family efflux transporter outer membrane factor (OMF) lipoprotein